MDIGSFPSAVAERLAANYRVDSNKLLLVPGFSVTVRPRFSGQLAVVFLHLNAVRLAGSSDLWGQLTVRVEGGKPEALVDEWPLATEGLELAPYELGSSRAHTFSLRARTTGGTSWLLRAGECSIMAITS